MFIDSHCHLNLLDLKKLNCDLSQIITNSSAHKVNFLLSVATHPEQQSELLAISKQFANVKISAGFHPEHAAELLENPRLLNNILEFAKFDEVIAIGETGLDYSYPVPETFKIDLEIYQKLQRQAFAAQIAIAKNVQKPLIVHTRMAAQDTLQLLKSEQACLARGIMHCFTENWNIAKQALDLEFYLGFSGIITFKNNVTAILEVVRKTPLNRILLETDSPYLAPVPWRGKINQPCYLPYIAKKIAEIKELSLEEVAAVTTNNFKELFDLA